MSIVAPVVPVSVPVVGPVLVGTGKAHTTGRSYAPRNAGPTIHLQEYPMERSTRTTSSGDRTRTCDPVINSHFHPPLNTRGQGDTMRQDTTETAPDGHSSVPVSVPALSPFLTAHIVRVSPPPRPLANVSKSQRLGDYEWVLWTTERDGSTQILLRIFAPTIHEARAHWGPQRENRAISSMLSYRTMSSLPKPPRDDFEGTGKVEVRISGGTFHKPNHANPLTMRALFAGTRSDRATSGKPRQTKMRVKLGHNKRTADKRRSA